jgi:hypothetical protein
MPTEEQNEMAETSTPAAPESGTIAKKIRAKKMAPAPQSEMGLPPSAINEGVARKGIKLGAELKKQNPTDPKELYATHPFERLMISLAWPERLSTSRNGRYGGHGQDRLTIPDLGERAEPWVGAGREESLTLGASAEVVEWLARDQDLCEAVCRITLSGCRNVNAYKKMHQQGENSELEYRYRRDSGPEGVARAISAVFQALKAEVDRPTGLRETLIGLAGDDEQWKDVGPAGDFVSWAPLDPSPQRGALARSTLLRMFRWSENTSNDPWSLHREMESKKSWNRVGIFPLVEKEELKTYLKELEGYEVALPVFFAESLKVAHRDPKLLGAFEKMCADRCSFGFESTRPGDGAPEILPRLSELSREKRSTSEARKQESKMAKGLAGEGVAGKLAMAAAKAYELDAPTPQGLVGEAKRALQERAGLSPASWKLALTSPAALAMLISGLEETAKVVKNARAAEARRATRKNTLLQDAQRRQDEGQRLVAARFDAAGRSASESLGSSVAARALTLGVAQGIAPESLERALRVGRESLDGHGHSSGFIVNALAGRLPVGSGSWENVKSPAAMRLRLADIEAVGEQGPAWVKIICEQLDKRVKKAIAAAGFKTEQEAAAAPGKIHAGSYQKLSLDPSGKPKKITALDDAERAASHSLQEDLRLLSDYIRSMDGGFFANLPKNFGWGTLMRQQEIWHEDQTRRKYENDPSAGRVWEPSLGALEQGEFKAVELVTGRQLIEEGTLMRHCVASYTSLCLDGNSRVFSIRRHGARVATLELSPLSARGEAARWKGDELAAGVASWHLAQNKGRHNAAVTDPAILAFCETVKDEANRALELRKQKAMQSTGKPEAPRI